MEKRPVIFFDLETTGNMSNHVRIIELAAKKVDIDTLEIVDSLYYKLNNDGIPIEKEAFEKHQISEDDVKDLPTFTDAAKEVYDFFKDCDLGGYYCTLFDNVVLFQSFLRAGIHWDFKNLKVYDIFTLYKKYNSGKLSDVYQKYTGKELVDAHQADTDIMATLDIYRSQRKLGEEFDDEELEVYKDHLDMAGNFRVRLNENTGAKEIYLNFGKHKGKTIDQVDKTYFQWMVNNSEGFPVDTRYFAKKVLVKLG